MVGITTGIAAVLYVIGTFIVIGLAVVVGELNDIEGDND